MIPLDASDASPTGAATTGIGCSAPAGAVTTAVNDSLPTYMAKQARRTSTDGGAPSRAADGFVTELTGDPAEIPSVRRAIVDLAERHGFAQRRSDLSLALDELIANAQEHGTPPITVRGWYDARLVLTVSDAGHGFDYGSIVRSHPPMMLGKRGRGLWIVRQLTDHVDVEPGSNGTTVRIELTHEPQIGA